MVREEVKMEQEETTECCTGNEVNGAGIKKGGNRGIHGIRGKTEKREEEHVGD